MSVRLPGPRISLSRRGIILTQKGSGVEVKFPSGEKRFVRNMPLTGDTETQDRIIGEAGRPLDYFRGQRS